MFGRAASDADQLYFGTVACDPAIPIFSNSRECGSSQRGLARLIFRIRCELLEIHTVVLQDGDSSNSNTVETLAMPGDDRLRLTRSSAERQSFPQSRKPDPQDTVSPTETQPTPTARTLQDQKLMPECKNLCCRTARARNNLAERRVRQHGLGGYRSRLCKCNNFNENDFLVGTAVNAFDAAGAV